jgi:hypothetical protein
MDAQTVTSALEEYDAHRWNAETRLCGCGEFFEATLRGNEQHDKHRMLMTLVAARGGTSRAAIKTILGRTPMEPFTDYEMNRMAQHFYLKLSDSPDITFNSMTCKPAIVDALRHSLDMVGSLQ